MYQPPTGQAYPQYAYPPHPQHEYGQGPPPGGVYATLPQQYPQQYPQQQPQPQLNLNQLPQPVPAPIPVYENAAPVYYSDIESNKQPLLGGDDALGASVRIGFIKKVYSILTVQLAITALVCILPFQVPVFRHFQLDNFPILGLCAITVVIIMYTLFCYQEVARKTPINYILLIIFTICEAYVVSFTCSFYNVETILVAVACTAGATFALTLYACTTKTDFTICGGMMFVLGLCALLLTAAAALFPSRLGQIVVSCFVILIYSLYPVSYTHLTLPTIYSV
eukprot:TRINITY_DN3100_c0_g1_i1.p1 TRINITY_DN3100_c0_g1~~TRINITY_DN3100_c0_g1_i1.p1  ORF type:complete len:280 (-),score=52.99 TRINITY_DN3100_c0_g1_i1:35-874(-)